MALRKLDSNRDNFDKSKRVAFGTVDGKDVDFKKEDKKTERRFDVVLGQKKKKETMDEDQRALYALLQATQHAALFQQWYNHPDYDFTFLVDGFFQAANAHGATFNAQVTALAGVPYDSLPARARARLGHLVRFFKDHNWSRAVPVTPPQSPSRPGAAGGGGAPPGAGGAAARAN